MFEHDGWLDVSADMVGDSMSDEGTQGRERMGSTMTHLELVHALEQLARRWEIDVLLQLERDDVGDGHSCSIKGAAWTCQKR